MSTAEQGRLRDEYDAWANWGPYVAERAWGTVREDYSENGDAWNSFPHDHARSRAFRWNEDGLFGISDRNQRWCLALSIWNGRDELLKERLFGLNGHEGNHGEDAKEEWWYLDGLPSHAYGRAAYAYPRAAFPYDDLRLVNGSRSREEPEYELLDTGIFDQGWWDVEIEHAKEAAEDLIYKITVTNRSTETDTVHVLPTMWFRNRWSWGREMGCPMPELGVTDHGGFRIHEDLTGHLELTASPGGTPLVCDNDTNNPKVYGTEATTDYPKDGINDHVVKGAKTVNPSGKGTKGSIWYKFTLEPNESASVCVRLAHEAKPIEEADEIIAARRSEADTFHADQLPEGASDEHAMITRQAFAGLLYSKQWYHFDVSHWLDGDPSSPPPPDSRRHGRNARWRHLNNADVIPMPDPWEYPWYAAWDTAFHCLPLTLLDPTFAKEQLLKLGREWFQHPNGQLPAYEWSFSDVNPPVHAWAALRVFEIDGSWDQNFLARVLHKLMLNFTWWVNRRDQDGNNLFDGGFLGLDNIGPFDRSAGLGEGNLEQSDATGWMAMYALDLLDMSMRLTEDSSPYEDLATKFVEHFAYISTAMDQHNLWHEEDGFYYDMLRLDNETVPMAVRSMVGLIPIFATRVISKRNLDRLQHFRYHLEWFRENKPEFSGHMRENEQGDILLSLVSPERLVRLLSFVLDEDEFLSPHGVRGLSKAHLEEPFSFKIGDQKFSVGYEPAESKSPLFGGNSNWRGPVWFPLNYLLIESLRRYDFWASGTLEVEYPTGSGQMISIGEVADKLSERLISLFIVENGNRPAVNCHPFYGESGPWHDRHLFHEYFHGDNGLGLGASHQTGWTSLVSSLTTDSAIPLGRRTRNR